MTKLHTYKTYGMTDARDLVALDNNTLIDVRDRLGMSLITHSDHGSMTVSDCKKWALTALYRWQVLNDAGLYLSDAIIATRPENANNADYDLAMKFGAVLNVSLRHGDPQ